MNTTATTNRQAAPAARATGAPLEPFGNGPTRPAATEGRDAAGRFIKGWKGGPGNPHARKVGALRSALVKAIDEHKIETLAERLYQQAIAGDVPSASLLLRYCIGRPPEGVDPDLLDLDEWRKLAAMPSYTEMVIASIDGVRTDKAIQDIRALKEVKPGGTREEHCLTGRDIIEERRAKRSYRRP